jgi:hypothetical protein
MDFGRIAMDPGVAARRFAVRLEEAGLPPFVSDEHGRAVILGLRPCCEDCAKVDVYVPGCTDDPRDDAPIPGVEIHRGPPLHPDDVTTVDGVPVTSPSRTLIDLAEVMTADELRACFARAREIGLLDPEALRAARARVEWRPSLEMLDEVIAEFCC